MRQVFFLLVVLCMSFASCIPGDENPGDGLPVEDLSALGIMGFGADTYSCDKGCYGSLISKNDTNLVINNDSEYDWLKSLASCLQADAWPEIDFYKNTVLAGIIITPTSCCKIKEITYSYDPLTLEYTIVVTLTTGAEQTPAAVFFWAIAKKVPADTVVNFQYKYDSII